MEIKDFKLVYSDEKLCMASVIINDEKHTTGDLRGITPYTQNPCAVFSRITKDDETASLGKVLEGCLKTDLPYRVIPTKIKESYLDDNNGYIYVYFDLE
jgi:hypothetical protein